MNGINLSQSTISRGNAATSAEPLAFNVSRGLKRGQGNVQVRPRKAEVFSNLKAIDVGQCWAKFHNRWSQRLTI